TTIVAAWVADGQLTAGYVGDSRLYRFSGGKLRRLTNDDSWTAVMAADTQSDPLLLQHHPLRHALTNVVGTRSRTEVHVVQEDLPDGDLLILTTDGVHDVLDDRRIQQVLVRDPDVARMAENLIAAALARGTHDNCTAVVARYERTA